MTRMSIGINTLINTQQEIMIIDKPKSTLLQNHLQMT